MVHVQKKNNETQLYIIYIIITSSDDIQPSTVIMNQSPAN